MRNDVRRLRLNRGLTQQQLAEALNVSRQTINAIETEKYDPSLPLALKMGKLFGQCVEKIFTLEEDGK